MQHQVVLVTPPKTAFTVSGPLHTLEQMQRITEVVRPYLRDAVVEIGSLPREGDKDHTVRLRFNTPEGRDQTLTALASARSDSIFVAAVREVGGQFVLQSSVAEIHNALPNARPEIMGFSTIMVAGL